MTWNRPTIPYSAWSKSSRLLLRMREVKVHMQECDETCSRGHLLDCLALEPAWDLGDLMLSNCEGCCPHGRKPTGMVALQSRTAQRFGDFIRRLS